MDMKHFKLLQTLNMGFMYKGDLNVLNVSSFITFLKMQVYYCFPFQTQNSYLRTWCRGFVGISQSRHYFQIQSKLCKATTLGSQKKWSPYLESV